MNDPYSRWSSFASIPTSLRYFKMSWALSVRTVEPYVVKQTLPGKQPGYPAAASKRRASAGS